MTMCKEHWMLWFLSTTTSAFQSMSQRVLNPRLMKTSFETVSMRIGQRFVTSRWPSAAASGAISIADAPTIPPVAPVDPPSPTRRVKPVVADAFVPSDTKPVVDGNPRRRKRRGDRSGSVFIARIAEACTDFVENLTANKSSVHEPFVVTRRSRQCHRPRCVPIVIMEKNHVVIIERDG